MSRATIVTMIAIAGGCGDNVVSQPLECTDVTPPETGLTLDGAREAHRRAALRQRLRYRETIEPGYTLRETAKIADQNRIDQGAVCAQELLEAGRVLFEHPFTYGDGLAAGTVSVPFVRVQSGRRGGPETTTCTSCHWRGGAGGAGGIADNSFLLGDGDRVSSADSRNPPALFGAGAAQRIAAEMSTDLAAIRDGAVALAKRTARPVEVELVTKGVSFGVLGVRADGQLDTDNVRGIDRDLIIRPFGWKGTAATIAEFVTEAAAVHLGIQSEQATQLVTGPDPLELGAGPVEDPDEDGIADELTSGQISALAAYIASLDMPIMLPHQRPQDVTDPSGPTEPYLLEEWTRGRVVFEQLGCATCHIPSLPLARPIITIGSGAKRGGVELDLSRDTEAPRPTFDAETASFPVFVFSDFKRHDLGEDNRSQHIHAGVGTRLYLTRRLWGLADTAPYFYDGRSVTVEHAIGRHGGEAAFARSAWSSTSPENRTALRVFLAGLRRAPRFIVP